MSTGLIYEDIPIKDCKFSRGRRLKFKGYMIAKQRKMIRTSTMILIVRMESKQWLGKRSWRINNLGY